MEPDAGGSLEGFDWGLCRQAVSSEPCLDRESSGGRTSKGSWHTAQMAEAGGAAASPSAGAGARSAAVALCTTRYG